MEFRFHGKAKGKMSAHVAAALRAGTLTMLVPSPGNTAFTPKARARLSRRRSGEAQEEQGFLREKTSCHLAGTQEGDLGSGKRRGGVTKGRSASQKAVTSPLCSQGSGRAETSQKAQLEASQVSSFPPSD